MEAAANLKSWNQAFEDHPIAATRSIEKQLRGNIVRDKDKLRALVGGNYRELLATAEQIVALDSQTQDAETQISNLRQACKPALYKDTRPTGDSKRQNLTAELSLLRKCLSVSATVLKQGAVLLASRLLVISRLLHRSLTETHTSLKSLDTLLHSLASLRRQLLRSVESCLSDPRSDLQKLIEAACSYCLATSCSPADAIQHFCHLRLAAIRQQVTEVDQDSRSIKRTFSYYVNSLQSIKALLGRQLPEALNQLQKHPILRDIFITKIQALELDDLAVLISPEIRNFTPYVARSELDSAKEPADTVLKAWSKSTFELVIKGLSQVLNGIPDLEEVLNLRMSIISTWLAVSFSVTSHPGVFESLRYTFNETANVLIERRTTRVVSIGEDLVRSLPSPGIYKSIWDAEFVSMSVGKGASGFQTQLRSRHLGLAGSLRAHTKIIADWADSVQAMQSQIGEIQRIRWQDKIEEADEEDEGITDSIVKSLSQVDPQLFLVHLDNALAKSISGFQDKLRDAASGLDNGENTHQMALYLLRAVRETEQRLESRFDNVKLTELRDVIPLLHQKLAAEVVKRVSTAMEAKHNYKATSEVNGSVPAGLPSPCAFKTLHRLCSIMAEVGGVDIWTQAAVSAVKEVARSRIFDQGHKASYIRNFFDESYLKAALGRKADPECETANGEIEDRARAEEYWSRTKLLFGLLA